MDEHISLSQFVKDNARAIQFCNREEDIPGCIDVLNMEMKQLTNQDDCIRLDQQYIIHTLNAINGVIQKAKDTRNQFVAQEEVINKLRQNIQIKQQQLQQQKDSYESEINKLMSTMSQFQQNEKQLAKQLNNTSINLQKMMNNYDDVARKYDIAEKTQKRLIQENQLLQDRLSDALRSKTNASEQHTIRKPNIKILEDTIRDLYKDIYQVNIEKNANFDANLQILAEAVAHVQKTYNEDMNNATQQIAVLNKRLVDLELKLRKYEK